MMLCETFLFVCVSSAVVADSATYFTTANTEIETTTELSKNKPNATIENIAPVIVSTNGTSATISPTTTATNRQFENSTSLYGSTTTVSPRESVTLSSQNKSTTVAQNGSATFSRNESATLSQKGATTISQNGSTTISQNGSTTIGTNRTWIINHDFYNNISTTTIRPYETTSNFTSRDEFSPRTSNRTNETVHKTTTSSSRISSSPRPPAQQTADSTSTSSGVAKWEAVLITLLVVTLVACAVVVITKKRRTWFRRSSREHEVQYLVIRNEYDIDL